MCPVFPRLRKGLADFAVVQSYLSTAAKWGISKLGALRDLFNGQARVPANAMGFRHLGIGARFRVFGDGG